MRHLSGFLRVLIFFLVSGCFASLMAQETSTISYHSTTAGYTLDVFDSQLSNWNTGRVEMNFRNEKWSLIPRLYVANRFDKNGFLLEGDAYKHFANTDYLYLNAGFSTSDIFVQSKLSAEYFNPFDSWEHSIGIRFMTFKETSAVGVLTGSLSRYCGSHLSSIRLNGAYGFENNDFVNYAAIYQHRYYLGDVKYIGFSASYGYDTTLLLISDQTGVDRDNPDQLSLGINFQSDQKKRRQWNVGYSFTRYNFVNYNRIQHTINLSFTLFKSNS